MAVAAQAALLDELMGRNRNLGANDKRRPETKWDDIDVCKYYLCSFCPHELFVNTKADLGRCEKIHDEDMRKDYQESSRRGKMGYEEECERYLFTLLNEVERKIQRGQQRLAMSAAHNASKASATKEERITMLTDKINELVQQAEELGCEGNVEEAQGVMKLCDQFVEERAQLENNSEVKIFNEFEKEMEVCQVCGALLVVGDVQQRIDEHMTGKQHMGYARIRSECESFKAKNPNLGEDIKVPVKEEDVDREAERERERERRRQERENERMKETTSRHSRERKEREERASVKERNDRDRDRRDRHSDNHRHIRDDERLKRRSRSRERLSRDQRSRDRRSRERLSRERHSQLSRERRSRSRDRYNSYSSRRNRSRSNDRSARHSSTRHSDDRDRHRSNRSRSNDRKDGARAQKHRSPDCKANVVRGSDKPTAPIEEIKAEDENEIDEDVRELLQARAAFGSVPCQVAADCGTADVTEKDEQEEK